MSAFDDLGLDKHVDRNSFTADDAVKVFQEAAKQVKSGETAAKLVNQILDVGFVLLRAIAHTSA